MRHAAALLVVLAIGCGATTPTSGRADFEESLPDDAESLARLVRDDASARGDEAADALGRLAFHWRDAARVSARERIADGLALGEPYRVRVRAARQLWRIVDLCSACLAEDERALHRAMLLAALGDGEPEVRLEAAGVAWRLADAGSRVWDDATGSWRPASGVWLPPEAVPPLRELLVHPHPDVRITAAMALRALGRSSNPAASAAREALGDAAVAAEEEPGFPVVLERFTAPPFARALETVRDPKRAGRDNAVAWLARSAEDHDDRTRERAIAALVEAIADEDESISFAAEQALVTHAASSPLAPALQRRFETLRAWAKHNPRTAVAEGKVPPEVRMNLRGIFTAEKANFGEQDFYGTDLVSVYWQPAGEPSLLERLSSLPMIRSLLPTPGPRVPEWVYGFCGEYPAAGTVPGIPRWDPSRSTTLDSAYRAAFSVPVPTAGITDPCAELAAMGIAERFDGGGQTFRAFAARNRDADPQLEVWSIDHVRGFARESTD